MSKICQVLRRLVSAEVNEIINEGNFNEDELAVFRGLLANYGDVRIMLDSHLSGNKYYSVKAVVKEKLEYLLPKILERRDKNAIKPI